MVTVLSDSFEQPLSNKKTPSSEVAISEPTSAAVFCLPVSLFGFECGRCASDDWLSDVFSCGFVSGFLSGLPDNPSCVKCVILASCAGSPVTDGRSKLAAVRRYADSTRVRRRPVQKERGPRETLWRVGHDRGIKGSSQRGKQTVSGEECPLHTHELGHVAEAAWPPFVSSWLGLEERGGPPLPGLAFLFGNIFHVGHVGACLGQHVVQVVADADEGESLFQEFTHASGAEEEDA